MEKKRDLIAWVPRRKEYPAVLLPLDSVAMRCSAHSFLTDKNALSGVTQMIAQIMPIVSSGVGKIRENHVTVEKPHVTIKTTLKNT